MIHAARTPARSRTHSSSPASARSDATDARIDRILGYLRAADDAHRSPTPTRTSYTALNSIATTIPLTTPDPVTTSTPTTVFDSVKTRLIAQELEVAEKHRVCELLKSQVKHLRAAHDAAAADHARELKSKLALQRKEYEAMAARQLALVDRAVKDKEAVALQAAQLAEKVAKMETQFQEKLATAHAHHARELKSAKSVWEAAEKVRRDKWMVEKAAKIKDQTVKSLEPELHRVLAQHKAQLALAEDRYREQLAKEKAAMLAQHEVQMQALRDKLVADRQAACEEEREFSRARYAKQLEREEIECSRRSASSLPMDELRAQVEQEKDARTYALDEARRRHAHELSVAAEQARIERDAWIAQHAAKTEAHVKARERALKDALVRERDAEIEKIIMRLETESGSSASEAAQRHRADVERLRAQHADEVRQLQDQWHVAMDKIAALGRQVEAAEQAKTELDRERWGLKNILETKDRTMDEMRRELDRLRAGEAAVRRQVEESVQDEIKHRDTLVASLRNELDRLKRQLEDQRRAMDDQLANAERDKAATLAMLEERVKQTVSIKDEAMADLRHQVQDLQIRNQQLDLLLERQRKELLM
ncbi:hypothetical protein AMAG_03673 [Allomyces macrogynus ATCC 38327]|uniref:5-azacytidine-induced protein 1 n=1 Tax=Allomyces macrogynus (strain ATCC 38327) TaxID=578462 RepID=A0A0L0SAF4_ALLM3|nr:hypothetical protein AMAG_03673 [Allomyces macrogynus ATCC 38327]|eukprot:KNE59389.1 hypothetical protein AMAG_03673 [Allomyces macrogynus ATCC 38327]